jgi:hypothetical protein
MTRQRATSGPFFVSGFMIAPLVLGLLTEGLQMLPFRTEDSEEVKAIAKIVRCKPVDVPASLDDYRFP